MPVIRLAFIITVCPMIIKHLFFMDVVCFVIGLNPGSSKSTWESKKKKKKEVYWYPLTLQNHLPDMKDALQLARKQLILFCDFGFDFSSFPLTLLQMCLCHIGGPPMSAFVGLQWAHGKKTHSVLGKGSFSARNIVYSVFVWQYHRLCAIPLHLFHIGNK